MKRGFTLLELLAVFIIMAMLMAIVGVRFQGPYRAAQVENAMQRVKFVDSQARSHARTHASPCRIVVDLDKGRLYSLADDRNTTRRFEFSLPNGMAIDRVVTPQFEKDTGPVYINISSRGTSRTYALCITSRKAKDRWTVFSGLTGRVDETKDERHVQELFKLLQSPGIDAD